MCDRIVQIESSFVDRLLDWERAGLRDQPVTRLVPDRAAVGGRMRTGTALVAAGREIDDAAGAERGAAAGRPPAERASSHGLRTGPVREVCEPPEKQRSSQTALPAIVAMSASGRPSP